MAIFSTPSFATTNDSREIAVWQVDYNAVLKQSIESGRPILALFEGSDWCPYCIKLNKEVFSQSAFTDYAKDRLILLRVDFPENSEQAPELRKQNEKIATQYGIEGFPTVLILDGEGRELARTGYRHGGVDKYIKHITTLLAPGK